MLVLFLWWVPGDFDFIIACMHMHEAMEVVGMDGQLSPLPEEKH